MSCRARFLIDGAYRDRDRIQVGRMCRRRRRRRS